MLHASTSPEQTLSGLRAVTVNDDYSRTELKNEVLESFFKNCIN